MVQVQVVEDEFEGKLLPLMSSQDSGQTRPLLLPMSPDLITRRKEAGWTKWMIGKVWEIMHSGFSFMPSFTNIWVPFFVLVFQPLDNMSVLSFLKGLLESTRQHRWGSEAVDICPELGNKSYSAFHIMQELATVFSCQAHQSDYWPTPIILSSSGKASISRRVAKTRSIRILLPLVR